jgi:hypothetical protein
MTSTPEKKHNSLTRREAIIGGVGLGLASYFALRKISIDFRLVEKFEQAGRLTHFLNNAEKSRDPTRIAAAQKIAGIWTIASAAAYYGQFDSLPLSSKLLHLYLKGDTPGVNLSDCQQLTDHLFGDNPTTGPIPSIIATGINSQLMPHSKSNKPDSSTKARILEVLSRPKISINYRFPASSRDFRLSLDNATVILETSPQDRSTLAKFVTVDNNVATLVPASIFYQIGIMDLYNFDPNSTTTLPVNTDQIGKICRELFTPDVADYILSTLRNRFSAYTDGVLLRNGSNYALPIKELALLEPAGFAKSYPIRANWPLKNIGPISFKID